MRVPVIQRRHESRNTGRLEGVEQRQHERGVAFGRDFEHSSLRRVSMGRLLDEFHGHDGPISQPFTRSYAPKRTFAQNPPIGRVVAS